MFSNPLLPRDGADPFLLWNNGEYFLSVTRGTHISFYRAPTLAGLRNAPEQIIWQDSHPERCVDMWAAEWFHLEGRWWCYYTASDGKSRHRAWVLRGQEHDLGGPYEFAGLLRTDDDDALYAIDFSLVETPRGRYGCWAGHPGHRLFLSRMESPTLLTGGRVLLEASGFGCPDIREGPFFLKRNGRVFLIYSACDAQTADYKLGMLSADENDDLMDTKVWTQHPDPALTRDDSIGVYGPGHQSFFQSPDGTQDWIAYHAKTTAKDTYADRVPCAKPFTWNSDGTPNFGAPLAFGLELEEPSGTRNS